MRKKVSGTPERPRVAVFRSNRHVYAQAIDDVAGHTLAAASTRDADASGGPPGTVAAAKDVGARLGARLSARGVTVAVFDRGGFRYHGRVAAVAEGVREAGVDL